MATGDAHQWVLILHLKCLPHPCTREGQTVDTEQALKVMGLSGMPDHNLLRVEYDRLRGELASRLSNAPTDGLRAKYQSALGELVAAYESLRAPDSSGVAGLSKSRVRDLPGESPSLTGAGSARENDAVACAPGDVLLDRYEIRQLIGQGGMGSVYKAFDRTRKEEIALKMLLPALLSNPQARERFLSEAKISSRLSHPNIVTVFDVQSVGDRHFLTMELLKGQTLRKMMDQSANAANPHALGFMSARELAISIGAALTYAHRFTVHRDVKPENIWVDEEGVYKLMDFGIARLLSGSQIPMTAAVVGSAYYMAPEQLKPGKAIDARTDEYSLAVVLYEVTSGEVPMGRAKSLATRVSGVPSGFSRAVDRALDPQPNNRFPDVASFVDAVQQGNAIPRRTILLAGGISAAALALIGLFVIAWPAIRSILPNGEATQIARRDALGAQAALVELLKRIEVIQRDMSQTARDKKSAVERLTDRANMARSNEERDTLRRQLASAEFDARIDQKVQELAEGNLFTVDMLSGIRAQQTLGEGSLRDGRLKAAATAFQAGESAAKNLIGEAGHLRAALVDQADFMTKLNFAEGTVTSSGGAALVILGKAVDIGGQAAKSLEAGKVTQASEEYRSASQTMNSEMNNYLDYVVGQYATLAQRHMQSDELDAAQQAIARGKQLQALKAAF
jgi:serine/threonine protein kinase